MNLQINELSKKIGKQTIFDNVSFTAEDSDIIALVGRNGAGKTTLFNTMMTIMKPDKGDVLINNKSVYGQEELLNHMVYIPDRFDYFKFSKLEKVIDYYEILYKNFNRERVMNELKELNILPDKSMNTLSKGQLTLCGTILGISTGADIILIDEPYDGIDVINRKKMDQFIIELADDGKIVVVSSHNLEKLDLLATKTIYLEIGKSGVLLDNAKMANFYKYQLVFKNKEDIGFEKDADSIVLERIGRVVTILSTINEAQMQEYIKSGQVLQYDLLKVSTEDLFFWDQEKGEL